MGNPNAFCVKCGGPLLRRLSKRGDRLKGGPRQRYCSSRCRTAAHRGSSKARGDSPEQQKYPNNPIENVEEKGTVALQIAAEAGTGAKAPLQAISPRSYRRHPKAIADSVYPGMWRVQWPDGRLSDMANRTRINDAIAYFLES
jgi:hypothetical protein